MLCDGSVWIGGGVADYAADRRKAGLAKAEINHRWTQIDTDEDCSKPGFLRLAIPSPKGAPQLSEVTMEFSPQNLCPSVVDFGVLSFPSRASQTTVDSSAPRVQQAPLAAHRATPLRSDTRRLNWPGARRSRLIRGRSSRPDACCYGWPTITSPSSATGSTPSTPRTVRMACVPSPAPALASCVLTSPIPTASGASVPKVGSRPGSRIC